MTTDADYLSRAQDELKGGDYSAARTLFLAAIAMSVVGKREPEPAQAPIPEGAKPVAISFNTMVAGIRNWMDLDGNGNRWCVCGHRLRYHYADLACCADCEGEFGDSECNGFRSRP